MEIVNVILVVLLAAGAAVAAPLLLIWALNTLFPVLAIQYTYTTWLASLLLISFLSLKISYNN